jgi:hypothetical protein
MGTLLNFVGQVAINHTHIRYTKSHRQLAKNEVILKSKTAGGIRSVSFHERCANLKGVVGLIMVKVSDMWISIRSA